MKSVINLCLIFCNLFSSSLLFASTHYKNQMWGGRAATMGGAYTAVADDASSIYYNPAGINYVQGMSLSGSANMFSYNNYTYKKTVGEYDWERESTNFNPNYFGIVRKMGRFGLGIGYALWNHIKENQNQIFENLNTGQGLMSYYSLILNTEDDHYFFSLAGSYELRSDLSLGLTLSYSYRKLLRLQNQHIQYANSAVEQAFDYKETRSKGVRPMFGLMWTPTDKWSLGGTMAYEAILTQFSEDVRSKEEKGSGTNNFMKSSNVLKDKPPLEFQWGIAYFPSPNWLFSMNIDYFYEFNKLKDDVINISIGKEYFINSANALRLGLFTNRTNVKEYNNSSRNLEARIQKYGISTGYSYYSKLNEITLGAIYTYGNGEVQPYSGSTSIRDVSYYEIKMILSSTYGF